MPRRHQLLAVAVALVWGLNFVVIHLGLKDFPPLLFAVLRFTFVALPAIFFVGRPQAPWKSVVLIGLFLSAGQFGLLFSAMHEGMPAGLASLVVQLQMVFTLGLAVAFLGERPHVRQLVGSAMALGGIGIIAAGRADAVPLLAIALCIAGAASWGAGNVLTRQARPPDAIALLVWSSLVAPLPLLGLSLALEGPAEIGDAITGVGPGGLFALGYVVLAASFFGYGVWTWLLHRHPASTVSPYALLVPVVGIASAWIFVGERPTLVELLGAVVVLGGLAVTSGVLTTRRAAPDPATPSVAEPVADAVVGRA
jgi:O-acetylserine/cysteine efflux transporter